MKTTINDNPILNKLYEGWKKAPTMFEKKQIMHEALSLLDTRNMGELISWCLNDLEIDLTKKQMKLADEIIKLEKTNSQILAKQQH